jgi:GTP cyclohydrolase IA
MARTKGFDRARAEAAIRELLLAFGLDPDADDLRETPARVAKAWGGALLDGYRKDPRRALGGTFPTKTRAAVVASRIPFLSMCPHHLLPLWGEAHIAFLPRGAVPGFGKIAALIDALAHRLVLQEDLAQSIAEALEAQLEVEGVAVVLEAHHLCVAVTDPARRGTLFRTTALVGDEKKRALLLKEIDASLRREPERERPTS